MKLFWVFAAGVFLGLAIRGVPVTADGAGAAAPSGNGDVNGDGQLNLTDAIYLLQHLFQGGPAPVKIECDAPPANGPKVRFLNDLLCQSQPTTATLELCGTKIARATAQDWGNCESLRATADCKATVTMESACGSLCFTIPVNLKDDHVYDFALSLDNLGVFAIWFDRAGSCATAPPTDQDPAAGLLQECPTAGLGGGAAAEFGSISGYRRPAPR
jgi:hypothetical protein